jgi:hypothetical protein
MRLSKVILQLTASVLVGFVTLFVGRVIDDKQGDTEDRCWQDLCGFWRRKILECPKTREPECYLLIPELQETCPASFWDRLKKCLGFRYEVHCLARPLRSGERNAIPILIKLLSDSDPVVRIYAAETLGIYGQTASRAVDQLTSVLQDYEIGDFGITVGEKAATAIGRIGRASPLTISLLSKGLGETPSSYRAACAVALIKVDGNGAGRKGMALLLEMLKSDDESDRALAIKDLDGIGREGTQVWSALRVGRVLDSSRTESVSCGTNWWK